jgi:hypothetical protein
LPYRLLSKNAKIRTYKTIILSVALYGCKIWCLTLREKQRQEVFENRVLRRIFVPKRDEVIIIDVNMNVALMEIDAEELWTARIRC